MHRPVIRRCLALLGSSALLVVLWTAVAAPAQADPICAGVTVSGTVTGTRQVGPFCQPYPGPVLCMNTGAGLDPTVLVRTYICVPF